MGDGIGIEMRFWGRGGWSGVGDLKKERELQRWIGIVLIPRILLKFLVLIERNDEMPLMAVLSLMFGQLG